QMARQVDQKSRVLFLSALQKAVAESVAEIPSERLREQMPAIPPPRFVGETEWAQILEDASEGSGPPVLLAGRREDGDAGIPSECSNGSLEARQDDRYRLVVVGSMEMLDSPR